MNDRPLDLDAWERDVVLRAVQDETLSYLNLWAPLNASPNKTLPLALFAARQALRLDKQQAAMAFARHGILPDATLLADKCATAPGLIRDLFALAGPEWTARRISEAARLPDVPDKPSAVQIFANAGISLSDPSFPVSPLEHETLHGPPEAVTRLVNAGALVTKQALELAQERRTDVLDILLGMSSTPRSRAA